ncbi:hypothetical protein KVT40_004368 [Elsinoe batatas]|uniref:Uncharacterized protein n=1 Tax=Elsinoe batatas TaxID=2601811 RepID=A0A8K0L6Q0_9PEZI|nr:hypothetical protein KVT40_004368 [Elsinoe batatas]
MSWNTSNFRVNVFPRPSVWPPRRTAGQQIPNFYVPPPRPRPRRPALHRTRQPLRSAMNKDPSTCRVIPFGGNHPDTVYANEFSERLPGEDKVRFLTSQVDAEGPVRPGEEPPQRECKVWPGSPHWRGLSHEWPLDEEFPYVNEDWNDYWIKKPRSDGNPHKGYQIPAIYDNVKEWSDMPEEFHFPKGVYQRDLLGGILEEPIVPNAHGIKRKRSADDVLPHPPLSVDNCFCDAHDYKEYVGLPCKKARHVYELPGHNWIAKYAFPPNPSATPYVHKTPEEIDMRVRFVDKMPEFAPLPPPMYIFGHVPGAFHDSDEEMDVEDVNDNASESKNSEAQASTGATEILGGLTLGASINTAMSAPFGTLAFAAANDNLSEEIEKLLRAEYRQSYAKIAKEAADKAKNKKPVIPEGVEHAVAEKNPENQGMDMFKLYRHHIRRIEADAVVGAVDDGVKSAQAPRPFLGSESSGSHKTYVTSKPFRHYVRRRPIHLRGKTYSPVKSDPSEKYATASEGKGKGKAQELRYSHKFNFEYVVLDPIGKEHAWAQAQAQAQQPKVHAEDPFRWSADAPSPPRSPFVLNPPQSPFALSPPPSPSPRPRGTLLRRADGCKEEPIDEDATPSERDAYIRQLRQNRSARLRRTVLLRGLPHLRTNFGPAPEPFQAQAQDGASQDAPKQDTRDTSKNAATNPAPNPQTPPPPAPGTHRTSPLPSSSSSSNSYNTIPSPTTSPTAFLREAAAVLWQTEIDSRRLALARSETQQRTDPALFARTTLLAAQLGLEAQQRSVIAQAGEHNLRMARGDVPALALGMTVAGGAPDDWYVTQGGLRLEEHFAREARRGEVEGLREQRERGVRDLVRGAREWVGDERGPMVLGAEGGRVNRLYNRGENREVQGQAQEQAQDQGQGQEGHDEPPEDVMIETGSFSDNGEMGMRMLRLQDDNADADDEAE